MHYHTQFFVSRELCQTLFEEWNGETDGRGPADEVGVQAVDDFTLRVELNEPVGHFLHLLTYSVTMAVPRHAVLAHGQVDNVDKNDHWKVNGGKSSQVVGPWSCGKAIADTS